MKAMKNLKNIFSEIGVSGLKETCIIVKNGLKKNQFNPEKWNAHITIGFIGRDLYASDGVNKSFKSILYSPSSYTQNTCTSVHFRNNSNIFGVTLIQITPGTSLHPFATSFMFPSKLKINQI